MNINDQQCAKKKHNGPEGAKYFSLLKGLYSFLAPLYFGKKNCLTIVGKNLFATPGPLSFVLTTVPYHVIQEPYKKIEEKVCKTFAHDCMQFIYTPGHYLLDITS